MLGAAWSMDIGGPISRTVADCAMTLGAIAGHDPKDAHTWDVPVPDYLAQLGGDLRGVRVGVIKERVYTDVVEREVGEAVIKAIAVLGELGATVEEVSLPLIVHSAAVSNAIIMADASAVHRETLRDHLAEYDYNNQIRLLAGQILPAPALHKALRLRHLLRQQILDALEQVDVLVMPTSSVPATLIPESAGIGSKQEVIDGYAGRRSFTSPFNLASTPALSVPCGFTSGDLPLPIGLQIAGKPFDEVKVFQVAHAYEQSQYWHTKRPTILEVSG
jgi:aspartyl-tRNA(Asn)/glutamyl-tRNA(Gln) amidotransferase subunit A